MANGQHRDGAVSQMFRDNVDSKGAIKLPQNFASEWAHLGSIATGNDLHDTYAKKGDVEYFQKNHKFQDGAILVKEVRSSNQGHLTTGDARWGGPVKVWFVMMKDSQNRFPNNPLWGNGWGWSLYKADDPTKQVATDFKQNCLQCHVPAKSTDWVYTDKYPLLADNPTAGSTDKGMPTTSEKDQTEKKTEGTGGNEQSKAKYGDTTDGASSTLMQKGKEVFSTCANCHSAEPKQESVGPSLFGIVGRKAGTEPGFNYSPAMKQSGVIWTTENIDKHLADVKGFIPGNYMASEFPQGVKDASARAAVVEYLKTLK